MTDIKKDNQRYLPLRLLAQEAQFIKSIVRLITQVRGVNHFSTLFYRDHYPSHTAHPNPSQTTATHIDHKH
ncbi:Hypothetical protein Cul210931_1791 [Corynebacterium ulcerans]|nr:Hypothetical protein Cul210931_1791 [Corynebacterium ulcerans]